ncbi:MAG: hypothetical protein WBW02_16685 [Candidatus Sulfotelmatobacter sp.]
MQYRVQPREKLVQCNELASEEIKKFLRAVDSYPDRVAQEPGLSFHRHLADFLEAQYDRPRHLIKAR